MIKTEKKYENTAQVVTQNLIQNRVYANLSLLQYSERKEQ